MPSTDATYRALVEVVIETRAEAGLTQQELADRLKRLKSFVGKVETGQRNLDVIEFIELARALRIEPTKLLAKVVQATGM
ncbi:helix-turn-helix transcriptional regulator [Povalibacter sp.]|uniref:helix-turn-helix domain-containing protein n=1 Tax=Povalibacter sp. TaxID=1962978 RepID=UPI002F40C69B